MITRKRDKNFPEIIKRSKQIYHDKDFTLIVSTDLLNQIKCVSGQNH